MDNTKKILEAVDTVCMNCPEDTLNDNSCCDVCPVRRLVDHTKATNMKTVKITIMADVTEESIEELKRIVDHQIDWLLNLSEFPEIKSVHDCTLEEGRG